MSNLYFDCNVPMGYNELRSAFEKIEEDYDFIHCFSIGKSVLKRRIDAVILGYGPKPVLFVGAHHSLEYLTSMILVKFIVDLCSSYKTGKEFCDCDVKELLSRQSIYIIPMLNPDGVELHLNGLESAKNLEEQLGNITGGDFSKWQANAHGVDLNHNYNAGFKKLRQMEIDSGINAPAPTRYGGKRAESEPETHALCNLCRRIMFSRVYAFHSQGEEIYWEYGENTPDNSFKIANMLANSCDYKISQPDGLASHGGFKDWFIDVFKRPGFTIEIGKGKNPLPPKDFESVYEKCKYLMLTALKV